MTDGVTKEANKCLLLDSGLSTKAYMYGNPHIGRLKCDGEESSNTIEDL